MNGAHFLIAAALAGTAAPPFPCDKLGDELLVPSPLASRRAARNRSTPCR